MLSTLTRSARTATGSMAAFLLLSSGHALASVDVQIIGGARTTTWEYEKADGKHEKPGTSTEIGLSLHVNPFKSAPVSFGLAVHQNNFDLSKALEDEFQGVTIESDGGVAYPIEKVTGNLKGLTYGPEIMAWIPMMKGAFRTFLRVGYAVGAYDEIGEFKTSGDVSAETENNYRVSGTHYGLGFMYSPAKSFGVLVEYTMSQQTLDVQKGKVTFTSSAGSTTTEMKKEDYTSTEKKRNLGSGAARLGLNFGF